MSEAELRVLQFFFSTDQVYKLTDLIVQRMISTF